MTVNYEIGKPRKDGRMRITLLVCISNTKKRVKTEILASPSDINRKGKIKSDSIIYAKIIDKSRDIEREFLKMETFLTGEKISAEDFIHRAKHSDIPSFFSYSEEWLSKTDIKGKKNYKTALRKFKSFTGDIPFSAFSHKLLDDFKYYLKDLPRAQSQYLSAIKKIYTDAEKDYAITPFASFHFDIPRQKMKGQRALDVDIIRKIFSYQGNGVRSILARDCSILSFCLCGINSVDLYNAPKIKGDILSYDRTKTKDRRYDNAHMEIEIPSQAREIVKKYKDTIKAFSFHRRFSSAGNFNTAINKGLKDICEELGIPKVTYYDFRHSWASIARNELGIDKYTIHSALCHIDRDTAIDDIYIKKDYKIINDANKKVVDYLFEDMV